MPLLPSLQIRNFRRFLSLDVDHLGDVTLVVGDNNIGKTTLLEAAALWVRSGSTDDLARLLSSRGELDEDARKRTILKLDRLFHGDGDLSIGPADRPLALRRRRQRRVDDGARWVPLDDGEPEGPDDEDVVLVEPPVGRPRTLRRTTLADEALNRVPSKAMAPCWYIASHGLEDDELAKAANAIALTPREADAARALGLLVRDVDRVQIIDIGDQKVPMAATPSGRVPLRSYGEGVVRIYGIAAALAAASGGLLLIDEFEAGLHYTALSRAWKLVFDMAAETGTQVIATTHDRDCVSAFVRAALQAGPTGGEGAVVRLAARADDVQAQVYVGDLLEALDREHVEVR